MCCHWGEKVRVEGSVRRSGHGDVLDDFSEILFGG